MSNTPAVQNKYEGMDDKTLLLVKGANAKSKNEELSYVQELATAIITVFQKHSLVRLRCIGKGAIGNASFATAIARFKLLPTGVDLRGFWFYQKVTFENGVERNGLVFELKNSVDAPVTEKAESSDNAEGE